MSQTMTYDLDAGDEALDSGGEESTEESDDEVTGDDDADGELAGGASPEASDSDAAGLSAAGEQARPAPEPASGTVAGPDLGVVDDAYQDFLRRFGQDTGDEPPSP